MQDNSKLKIITLESIDSTNNYAIKLAEKGEDEIVVVRAFTQIHGRGRFNRSWISPKDKGLYISFLLRPKNKIDELYFFPLFFSFAVVKTINGIIKTEIKFPNDVIIRDKKIAGILIEAKGGRNIDFVIVGIGININSTKNEILDTATSLYLETGKIWDIENLFKKLVFNVLDIYVKCKKGNFNVIFEELKKHQNFDFENFNLVSKEKEAINFV